ncbi:MAG: hypothetical protein AAF845_06200 [Bacteroidota bacterium]
MSQGFVALLVAVSLAGPLLPASTSPEEASASVDPDTTRRAQHLADIAYLQEQLEARHPDPYAVASQESFEAALDAVRADLDALSDTEVSIRLREAVALLGDPHTNATFLDAVDYRHQLPVEFDQFAEGVFITGAYPEHQDLLGLRVLAVGGRAVDDLRVDLARFVAAGREPFARKRFPVFLRLAELHRYLGASLPGGRVRLQLADAEGRTREVAVQPLDEQVDVDRLVYLSEEIGHPTWINYGEEDPALIVRDQDAGNGIYLVQYSSCWGRELEVRYGDTEDADRYPSFTNFADRVVARLQAGDVRTLIVDLRANSGGSSPQGTRLVRRISALPEGQRPERVVVAVSEQTFSSAVINAMDLRLMLGAEFVGMPTGGAPNHFGEVRVFALPNSGQVVAHSTASFGYMNGDPVTIRPDRRIEPTFADFMAGSDPVLAYVRATSR